MQRHKKLNNKFFAISLILCFLALNTSLFWKLTVDAAVSSKSDSTNNAVSSKQEGDKPGLNITQTEQEQEEKQRLEREEAQNKEEAQKQAELAVDNKFSKLQNQITALLQKQPGTYGFMLSTKVNVGDRTVLKTIGYNQNESFKMASTYKVPVILYLYEQVAQTKLNLQDKLVYEERFYTTGTGSLQYQKPGGSYSVSELASLSIRQSDNVALYILINKLGRDNILKFMKSLGGTSVYDGTPFGTPNDLSIYMKAVEEFSQQNPELGNQLIDDLRNTVFNDRIRAGTPNNIAVAHKIGNLAGVVNDVGIVYSPKGPYILALMSKDVSNDVAAAKIETEVAKMVYDNLTQ